MARSKLEILRALIYESSVECIDEERDIFRDLVSRKCIQRIDANTYEALEVETLMRDFNSMMNLEAIDLIKKSSSEKVLSGKDPDASEGAREWMEVQKFIRTSETSKRLKLIEEHLNTLVVFEKERLKGIGIDADTVLSRWK